MNPAHLSELQDAIVTVMGLGRYKQGSGTGAVKWLMRHGAQIVITDLKSEKELRESVEEISAWYEKYRKEFPDRDIYQPVFVLGEHHEDDFTEAQLIVQNPPLSRDSEFIRLAREHGVSVESDVSLFFRLFPNPIYAVTGTRGKATVTALLNEFLKTQYEKAFAAGNMYLSPLEFVDDFLGQDVKAPASLEMTSWFIESIQDQKRGPDIAVLTNMHKDHLNRYPSFDAYVESKLLLFKNQTAEQKAVLNKDREEVVAIQDQITARKYWFSEQPFSEGQGCFVENDQVVLFMDGQKLPVIAVSEVKMQGGQNMSFVLAAVLSGYLAGISVDAIANVLKEYLRHAGNQETVGSKDGVIFVNDTMSTSPDATISALDRFGQSKLVVLIVGGKAADSDLEILATAIKAVCKYVIYLPGEGSDVLKGLIGEDVHSASFETMEEAVKHADAASESGEVVLLSPGADVSSPFASIPERGQKFEAAVNQLT